ncbi:MAG: glycosyltransferase family 2 protein [Chitinophagales bacterium]|nr:glycosyltransferase family 2 protein [Chitinophagales bacterium]
MPLQQPNSAFFSVIIPTYNRAAQLHLPIESILKQTFTSWELIIVDDGSTDNTKEIVAAYQDPRIRYIYQQNMERSAARNNGIAHAQGQYVCFLDSDDYYLPEHLASFHQKIQEHKFPVAVFYCNTLEDNNGKLISFPQPKIEARNNVEWVVLATMGSPRTCLHHAIFTKYQFNPKVSVGEDVDLWVRVLKEYPLIHNDAATVVFVAHGGRTVMREESYFASLENLKRIIREDNEYFISGEVRKTVLSNAYLRIAQYYIENKSRGKALSNLVFAFFRFPAHRAKEKFYLILKVLPLTALFIRWKEGKSHT